MTQPRAGGPNDVDIAIDRGWILITLAGKHPVGRWRNAPGLSRREASDALFAGRNLGLVTGARSGVYVIDVDLAKGGRVPEAPDGAALPATVTVRTGGGGKHLYFRHPGGKLPNTVGRLYPHVDTRGDGGYVVYSGSVHPDTGAVYEWEPGRSPLEIDLAPLPQWVINAVIKQEPLPPPEPTPRPQPAAATPNKYVDAAIARACGNVASAPEGSRNHTLNREAYSLGGLVAAGALDEATVETELMAAALAAGLPQPEASASIRSGLTSGKARPRQVPEPRPRAQRSPRVEGNTAPAFEPLASEPTADGEVYQLPGSHTGPNVIQNPEPMRLAEHFLNRRQTTDGVITLRRFNEDWYRYTGAAYDIEPAKHLHARLYRHVDKLYTPYIDKMTGEEKLRKLEAKKSVIIEIDAAMPACGPLVEQAELPCWLDDLDGFDGAGPASEYLSVANGLLHLPTRQLYPHTPRLFTTTSLPFDYNIDAPPPQEWDTFLSSLWDEDEDAKRTLQEWFGYCLTPSTAQQKMLMIIGPKRSGKGTIARVLNTLLGKHNVCAPTLAGLGTNFGSQVLINKRLAIIGDARLSGRTDLAQVTERLLSISGEDHQTIARKHREDWNGYLPTRFMLLSNELPRFSDASAALASRFILLPLERSFYGREDQSLFARLTAEMPGILNWALDGLTTLMARGHFRQPDCGRELIEALEDLASPISAFLRDRCDIDQFATVPCADLYSAWCDWCKTNGRDHTGSVASFGRDIRAVVPGIRTKRIRLGARIRLFEGITLKSTYDDDQPNTPSPPAATDAQDRFF